MKTVIFNSIERVEREFGAWDVDNSDTSDRSGSSAPVANCDTGKTGLYGGDWAEPDLSILNPRRNPPEFPSYLFGPAWSKWILSRAEGCSAPPDYVGLSLLSLVSTLVGCSRFVSPWEGWKEPPVLWVALVGNPSSGKSPALDCALDLVKKIERDETEKYLENLKQYEGDKLVADAARLSWEEDVKEAAGRGYPPPKMPDKAIDPERPQRLRITVSDTTPEALVRVLLGQPKGILSKRDELAGWFGGFNRYTGGQGGDRPFWLEAYGARSFTIDRARSGGEVVLIPHLAVSVIGGIQPDKLQSLIMSGDDDGLSSRFLYCDPDPVPPKRPRSVTDDFGAERAIRRLHELSMLPNDSGELSPVIIRLEDNAADFFQNWREEHIKGDPVGRLLGWWGKLPGVCLRLALCFEYLKYSTSEKVEKLTVERASVEAATVLIEAYLKPMAERVYGDAALPAELINAATLAKWMRKAKPEQINTRNLQRNIRLPGLKTAPEIAEAITILEEGGWVRSDFYRSGSTSGQGRKNYIVNPKTRLAC